MAKVGIIYHQGVFNKPTRLLFSMVCGRDLTSKSAIIYILFRNGRLCRAGTNAQRSWENDFKYPDISPSSIRAAESWTIFRPQEYRYPARVTHRCSFARLCVRCRADKTIKRRGGAREGFKACIFQAVRQSHDD